MFDKCKQVDTAFVLGKTLLGVVTDWSDSEIKGLKNVVGEETAGELLKGCQVHWLRSCKRVAERIASSTNKHMEYRIFIKIATKIQVLKSAINTVVCFETLMMWCPNCYSAYRANPGHLLLRSSVLQR